MDEYRFQYHTKHLHNAKRNGIKMSPRLCILAFFVFSKIPNSNLPIWWKLCSAIFNICFRILQPHKNYFRQQHPLQHRQQHLRHSLRHFLNLRNTNSIQIVIQAAYIHQRHIKIHLELSRVMMWVRNIKNHFHYQFHP